ncbi:MAG: TetR family transcriptional regulator [Alphaproteobacteria bacterium]|nr:TetR family transcriptional regulator [Alphaproteobacteria bacterium]
MTPSLPDFPAPSARDQAVLDASRTVVQLFLRERSVDFSVKELAGHTGLSERTFYRYFPRKEDAIRPFVAAAIAHVVAAVRTAPAGLPPAEAFRHALAGLLDMGRSVDVETFLTLVNGTDRLRAVWLQVLTDAEEAFAGVVAERLDLPADSVHARFAGAVVVSASRLAIQPTSIASRPPSEVFAACMALVGPALLSRKE